MIAIDFITSKSNDEEHVIHWKSYNTEIMTYDKTDEVVKELCESLFYRYQIELEASMKGSDFIFDRVNLLH